MRGDDAEHPKFIPMDLPSSHQVPSGPMTRSRARALETEVTSLLSQFHFDDHETWLLPQTETLCILRYQGVSHGDAKEQGESEEEDGREDGEGKGLSQQKPRRSGLLSGRSGLNPDDPDRRLDDPASARMIRTPARTIRIICPTTPEPST